MFDFSVRGIVNNIRDGSPSAKQTLSFFFEMHFGLSVIGWI